MVIEEGLQRLECFQGELMFTRRAVNNQLFRLTLFGVSWFDYLQEPVHIRPAD
jgi:hypothetical protein